MKRFPYFALSLSAIALCACSGSSSASSSSVAPSSIGVSVSSLQESGGIISLNQAYYKVNNLVSGQTYLLGYLQEGVLKTIGATDVGCELVYTLRSGGGSRSENSSALAINDYELSVVNGTLSFAKKDSTSLSSSSMPFSSEDVPPAPKDEKGQWVYDGSSLAYAQKDRTSYVHFDGASFVLKDTLDGLSPISAYTSGAVKSPCIEAQPETASYVLKDEFKAPTYAISVKEGVVVDDAKWYLNGVCSDTDSLSFSPTELADKECGVYPIYCEIAGHDANGVYYQETSFTTNFIIASGIIPNSVLTFSDVHEEYSMIGKAIAETMAKNGGMIPALIVATGDWVNGATPPDEVIHSFYLPQIKGQLGGIDAVYVAGNHESYLSIAQASIESGLGADESNLDGMGVIFDTSSAGFSANAKSSALNGGLIVYGINYFSLEKAAAEGEMPTYSYDAAIADLRAFLEERKATYNGELILISAHAGLHALGIDPHSDVTTEFGGDAGYNIDHANMMADLLNEYAEDYGMNFSFLFGHNHSKKETEFCIAPGERLYAVEDFQAKEVVNEEILFSYAHAGYLSSSIGSASAHYTFIEYDDDSYRLGFSQLAGKTISTVVEKR